MEKIISYEYLRNFAYSNDKAVLGDIKGIVLEFMGLGGMKMNHSDPGLALEYAQKGIIYVIPYSNPWNWMNRQTVKLVDEIVEVLLEKYSLDKSSVKIASTGGSMGGLCALVYCAYAKITPSACVTDCPVCDLVFHFGERGDLPRTLYSAFFEYEGTMNDALKSCSPLHLTQVLPKIPYTVFHCEADKEVNLQAHSERFVKLMEKEHDIKFIRVPLRGHCDLSPKMKAEYIKTIEESFN